MSALLVLRPTLSERIAASESRTEAFASQHFGSRQATAALDLHLGAAPNAHHRAILSALLDICLRMTPIVSEVRLLYPETERGFVEDLLASLARHVPFEVASGVTAERETVSFAIGPTASHPSIDATDWFIAFGAVAPRSAPGIGAGPIFAALEAAKYVFLRAVDIAYGRPVSFAWPAGEVFDLWAWKSVAGQSLSTETRLPSTPLPPVALIGCGGVGAGYLWFLRHSRLRGRLLLVDDDAITWHNMNRLFYATLTDADAARLKVESASAYMGDAWSVQVIPKKAEHDDAIAALKQVASDAGLITSAVGEPEARRFLARRGFRRFHDAATNSDGSVQVLALNAGVTTCLDCHLRDRAPAEPPRRCDEATTAQFAGVLPHLSAYAGALLAFEQVRAVLYPSTALGGANTQSVFRPVDAMTREATARCNSCPIA